MDEATSARLRAAAAELIERGGPSGPPRHELPKIYETGRRDGYYEALNDIVQRLIGEERHVAR